MPLAETTMAISIAIIVYLGGFLGFHHAGLPTVEASGMLAALTYLGEFLIATAILFTLKIAFVRVLDFQTKRMTAGRRAKKSVSR